MIIVYSNGIPLSEKENNCRDNLRSILQHDMKIGKEVYAKGVCVLSDSQYDILHFVRYFMEPTGYGLKSNYKITKTILFSRTDSKGQHLLELNGEIVSKEALLNEIFQANDAQEYKGKFVEIIKENGKKQAKS